MRRLSVREIRASLSQLERILEQEGEPVVTRNGEPIARALPAARTGEMPSHEAFRSRMPRLSVGREHYIRADRDER